MPNLLRGDGMLGYNDFNNLVIGWPLSGVVYFNILRIYIITGFVQCKSVGALSRDVLVYIIHNLLYAVFKT